MDTVWVQCRSTLGAEMPTRARIVRIGNSQGIRIPKALLEQAGLPEDVLLDVRDGTLVVSPARPARAGWASALAAMAAEGGDHWLDGEPRSTTWDETEWRWDP